MKLSVILACIALLSMTACIGELMEMMCDFVPDASHCYQGAAIQQADPYGCEKVKAPAEFKYSNPPKDKCYLLIAENTGDYDVCDKIVGGPGSYSKEECIEGAAVKHEDPAGCRKLTGADFESCKKAIGATITGDKIDGLLEEIDELKSKVGRYDDPEDKKKLAELEQKKKDMLDFASPEMKAQYAKEKIADTLKDVEDEDVASSIRQEYIKYRSANPDKDVTQLMSKLQQIKEEKELMKSLDDQANTLVDSLKEKVGEYADEQKEEMINEVTEKGWGWMKDNSADSMKYKMGKLEELKAKYDKASEKYAELNEKIEKIKKVYDEVSGVYKKVDEYNKMLAEGKIDKGQAKVLKGAVLLGKGLEYATSYVPIFGSTVSTITKETFDATIKLANTRAQRNKKLNDCIEDPENCDPDGITGY